jgi:hypothetical protein
MATIQELEAQVNGELAPQVAQIKALFRAVAAKQPAGLELSGAVRAATSSGYVRWSSRAGRLMFTDKGKNFHRQMKRFG